MKQTLFLISVFAIAFNLHVNSQNISEVRFYQDGNHLIIHYNFNSEKNNNANISLYVSTDGGVSFTGPLPKVTGDVGENIAAGNNLKIRWDVLTEMPDFSGNIVFDVRAELIANKNITQQQNTSKESSNKVIDNRFLITYTGSTICPIGLTIGKIGGFGYYTSVRINPDFLTFADYSTDGSESDPPYQISNYTTLGYYRYTNNSFSGLFSFSLGASIQAGKAFYFTGGMRYTLHRAFYEIEEFKYFSDEPTNTAVVQDYQQSEGAFDVEAGFMIRSDKFIYGLGVTTPIREDYFSMIFSMGLAL